MSSQSALPHSRSIYLSPYSFREEIAHTISHGAGLVAAFVATLIMVGIAAWSHSSAALIAVSVYGLCLTFLFAASTFYHGSHGSRFQRFFKLLDHVAIYLKIAGSYTPFALLVLPSETGIPLLAFVWGLAAVGIGFKILGYILHLTDQFKWLSLGVYLLMGWSGAILLGDLYSLMPPAGFVWLLIGGALYTVGAGIYAIRSIPMGHFIWHILVLAASACHVITVAVFVL